MNRDPQSRLRAFFDHDTMRLLAAGDDSGVLHARGSVDGTPAVAFATDATRMGGAVGVRGCRRIVEAIDLAVRERVPVVGVWHSGGARLDEGMAALDAAGQVFAATVRASGRIPQVSVLLGPTAGSAAYASALTDIVITSTGGATHAAHLITDDDATAVAESRRTVRMLGHPGRLTPADVRPGSTLGRPLDSLLPVGTDQAYDVRPLIRALLDGDGLELHASWAPNVVTTLGRFAGRTVGVVANNPDHLDGCLDADGAEKAARFVRMCDALALPLIVLVDTPGYLSGQGREPDGVVVSGVQLLHAFAEAVVPRVTLLTRRAYGGAYLAMNSTALGASAVFAWPGTKLAVHDPAEAVPILHHRRIAAAPPDERDALHERLARDQVEKPDGLVDAVIRPEETRRRIAEALAAAPPARGAHGNIPL
ncbi:acetyl-CoA/propionyl-CoA carboxylase carboxyl transferase subunit [Actinoplanes regularis]|uniref:Acetyl-CoA/propionyl-CoA carboxylase carboxyl transferase subunit n=2 Tax=Actinoplanes regularis TaxID=52697 RepID=A0A238WP38_9ACTN|nr:putative propionyl-CoA carboxylase beta chain 6 [Actinoplanes regularis]SNR48295.1 acetyl-CoA/propionyl-CoA carboxylase carboxyl transferase subunit [Actinoplanes regularis]